ncbi:hypothetical protein [Taibaiella soli]|uniref:DUF5103 domain-containing protein n=1 Tax=Taibaiella soli TaxID=1649169 RepID=A0A2W2BCW5_9BACT|nr:hypothetical protein [Taibaiella soli]PZF74079.1 hypothetical protein DN068_05150 [Taibaiella soli]
MKKLITLFAAVLLYTAAGAQAAKIVYSDPIEIPAVGYNKLLQVRNGNTLLLHFEPYKGIVLKVFDKSHKEIASQKHTCEIVDINALNQADFKGLFDINGEAVLFIQQPYLSRMSLMRLRIDANTGKLLKEEVVERAPTFKNETIFYVQQFSGKDQYAILHYKNLAFMPDEKIKISIWSSKNEKLREVSIDKPFEELHTMRYNGFNAEKDAIYACFSLYIQIADGQFKQYLYNARLNENDTACSLQKVEIDDRIPSYFSVFTPNEFAETENMMAMNMYSTEEKVGENKETAYFPVPYFFSFAKSDFSVASSSVIEEDKINEKTAGMRDTMTPSAWIPLRMHTSKTGASAVFYEMQHDYFKHEKGKDFHQTYLGHLAVNILNDNGSSVFCLVIPKKQVLYSLYEAEDLSRRNTTRHLFRDMAAEDHYSQFASFEVLPVKGNYHILVNDLVENFDRKITDTLNAVTNFDYSNAICYTLNRKRELTKSYLFGTPAAGEAKPCQLESANYNESTGLYAVVMQEYANNKTSIKIAWCQFDPSI